MTAVEIINETVEYYSADVSRRSVSPEGGCYYKLEIEGEETKYCAVGRCFDQSVADMDHQNGVFHYLTDLKDKNSLDEDLLPQYKGHPIEFWNTLQMLHDRNGYWDHTGLSPVGYVAYKELLKSFAQKEL